MGQLRLSASYVWRYRGGDTCFTRSALRSSVVVLISVSCSTAGAAVDEAAKKNGIVECTTSLVERHNPGFAKNIDTVICFEGYISNFNTSSVTVRKARRYFAVPHWVIHRIDRAQDGAEAHGRPTTWLTVPDLLKQRIAPTHGSYEYSKAFRNSHPDWYERGHLAQKYLTERVSRDAAWFTHNVANAVPQRKKFNTSTWLTLECLTGAWANKYERVWVITGPVFKRKRPTAWLTSNSNKGTVPVAIPISMFKIVMKRNSAGDFEALGFSMPQAHRTYQKKGPWDPAVWFKSISEIERMTGQEFLLGAPGITQEVKDQEPTKLWPVAKTDFSSGCKGQRIDVL